MSERLAIQALMEGPRFGNEALVLCVMAWHASPEGLCSLKRPALSRLGRVSKNELPGVLLELERGDWIRAARFDALDRPSTYMLNLRKLGAL
jgi:hypothetical protein